jgi:enoyl-CoA hydratase/carnithine racemase
MEVVRQELRPDVARRLVLFGQNITATAAVEAGVFDEAVDPEALLDSAMAKASEFVALPQTAFARSKRQLRSRACDAMEVAIAGAEPLLNGWLSKETIQAAAAVLARKA